MLEEVNRKCILNTYKKCVFNVVFNLTKYTLIEEIL